MPALETDERRERVTVSLEQAAPEQARGIGARLYEAKQITALRL